MADLVALQANLGVTFRDMSLLERALVHRSYLNENVDNPMQSNERLEFLGDAVLGYVIAEMLYAAFPDFSEGDLTRVRSSLVCGETLARVALALHLGDYLYLGRGEEDAGGRCRSRNLSCALEAVIGSVLVDQGMDEAKHFVLRVLGPEIERAIRGSPETDCKSRLQQVIQSERKITPVYRILEESGPDHARVFTVEVVAGESVLGVGSGPSKRAAEVEAAKAALNGIAEVRRSC